MMVAGVRGAFGGHARQACLMGFLQEVLLAVLSQVLEVVHRSRSFTRLGVTVEFGEAMLGLAEDLSDQVRDGGVVYLASRRRSCGVRAGCR